MVVEATVAIVHVSATPSAMVTAIVALTMMQDAMHPRRPRVRLLLALPLHHVMDFMETAAQQPTGCTWDAALRK